MNQTLVLCKPDAVERKLVGNYFTFEEKGLSISSMRMLTITPDIAALHYAEHVGKPFYDDLVAFIGRSNSVAMVVEGPDGTWEIVGKMMGQQMPPKLNQEQCAETSAHYLQNLVHGSDSAESAQREIGIFFE